MAEIALTENQIALGGRVRDALDAARVPIHFLMWYKPEDSDEYELLLETPLFRVIGTRQTYEYFDRLTQVLKDADLRLDDVTLILPGSPLVNIISRSLGVSDGNVHFSFARSVATFPDLKFLLEGLVLVNRPHMEKEQVRRQAIEMETEISRMEHAA